MRIIPFTLRITHYSHAPASWPGRPKIHVTGFAPLDTPAGLMTESEDRQRRLRGTVEMTASGDVRWTIVRSRSLSIPSSSPCIPLTVFLVFLCCCVCCVVGGVTRPPFFSPVIFSRGRPGSVVHRRRTDRRTRLSHGSDRYVDQRRTRII